MPLVKIRKSDSLEVSLRKLRRACERSGMFIELRKRQRFEKPTAIRKRKAVAAVKREARRSMRDRLQKRRW